MRRQHHALLILLFTVAGNSALAADKSPISIDDLYRFDSFGSTAVARDGNTAVCVRNWIDRDADRQRHSLWLVKGSREHTRPLETGQPDARKPVFSPDGKWIAFLSTRVRPQGWRQTRPVPAESEPASDIWLIRRDGSKAIPLGGAKKPYGRVFGDRFYGRLAFSPDGKKLTFVADDGKELRTAEEIAADVIIVRPDQGEGYTGYQRAQVWIAELDSAPKQHAASRITQITDGEAWYGDPRWSPDGKTIVVHANRTADRESVRYSINKNYDLWAIDVKSHALRQLTSGQGPEVSPRFSPDGRRLVCLSVPRKGPHADVYNLAVVTLDGKSPQMTVVFDHHSPKADHRARPSPVFPLAENCWDGNRQVIYTAALGMKSKTVRVDLQSSEATELTDGESPYLSAAQQRRALTPPGNIFLEDRLVAASRTIVWQNDEGKRIEGVLTLPPESVAKKPYKLLVYPHGGPHGRSVPGFNHTVQVFAAQGYAVFQPNFRGSSGYGRKFLDADRNDFGGGDMRDILTGVDSLVKKGIVDPKQQYVYGSSYGGFMTSWLVGHTTQFRAAVAQNAVTDLNVMWGLSDLQSWTEWEFGGHPWEVPEAMRRHSPITYADKVRTPTLVLHSREDRRCPLAMGRMFYQSLLDAGVPTAMVIYPNEGHGIRQPRHREDVLRRTLAWFDKHSGKSSLAK